MWSLDSHVLAGMKKYRRRRLTAEEQLIMDLFRGYDTDARAVVNTQSTVTVNVNFMLLRIQRLVRLADKVHFLIFCFLFSEIVWTLVLKVSHVPGPWFLSDPFPEESLAMTLLPCFDWRKQIYSEIVLCCNGPRRSFKTSVTKLDSYIMPST